MYSLLRPLLFQLDAERAHRAAMAFLRIAHRSVAARLLLAQQAGSAPSDPRLAREVFGLRFPNPIGLAAGFDKDGEALRGWEAMGFGFIELGTITALAQPGNPRPRLFRHPEQRALVNRMGFNNHGSEAAAAHFAREKAAGRWPRVPVGINIGKSKAAALDRATEDYLASFGRLHSFADYVVVNVSSPNTPGLRSLQNRAELGELLGALQGANRALPQPRPLLVKIAPDLEDAQIADAAALAEEHGLAGIVATNTTIDHSSLPADKRGETGGLSGRPLRERATAVVRFLAERTRLPIIGVGGVEDADSAREKLDAGAALVQLYTGFVYGGPQTVGRICRGLLKG